jgi:DNA helicase-2/ATP-dependent DNA helicase PcrA
MDLSHLNPSQRAAVECTEGPLLVLAGAGSGKTRVITTRIAYLLSKGIKPEAIVALSFTNKAAEEMRERVAKLVGHAKAQQLVLGTFHNLGVRMMRKDPKGFEVPKRFTILDQGDVYGVVRSLLREHGIHGPGAERRFDVGAIVQRISLWKNEFLEAQEVRDRVQKGPASEYDEIAGLLYEAYDDRLRGLGACDFDDLVCRVAGRLMDDEALRIKWAKRFKYLMVDEYQDTNTAQFQMVRALLGPRENLCVVGDDDQAIYGWRGAKVANILGFDMYFRNATVVKLEENYRSRPQITSAANAVIVHNQARHEKSLVPTRPTGDEVMVVTCESGEAETRWVCSRIRKLIVEEQVAPRDIAVLYRSARLARPVEETLQEHGINHRVLGGQSFYDKKETKDVLAYLKVLVTPHDDIAVRRALDTPPRGIGRKTMEMLDAYAQRNGCRLMDAVHQSKKVEGLSSRPARALENFSAMIKSAGRERHAGNSVVLPLKGIIDSVRLRENVLKETGSSEMTQNRWTSVEWLLESLERFEDNHDTQKASDWYEYLGNMSLTRDEKADKNEEAEKTGGLVTLATLHSSKGLEWPHTFIIGCEEGIMPHKRVMEVRLNDAIEGDLEEERRLFYVGVTRARDRLWLTYPATRVERGREVEVKPSRFLDELPEAGVRRYDARTEEILSVDDMEAMATAFMSQFEDPSSKPAENS